MRGLIFALLVAMALAASGATSSHTYNETPFEGMSATAKAQCVEFTSTAYKSGNEIFGNNCQGTPGHAAKKWTKITDTADAFTTAWWKKKEVADALKANLQTAGITVTIGGADKMDDLVREWLELAWWDKIDTRSKGGEYYDLIKAYGLEQYCQIPTKGKEVLWSGHVENSKFAAKSENGGMTPLESTKLAEALSETFGTENFPVGIGETGFGSKWLPTAGPMFNGATVVYSTKMEPTNGLLKVYVNQLKEGAVFFKTECELIMEITGDKRIKNLEFVFMTNPETVASYHTETINVDGKNGDQAKAEVLKHMKGLPEATVKLLWDNFFNVAVSSVEGGKESHPLDDKSKGTRKKDPDAAKIYKGFFTNFKEVARAEQESKTAGESPAEVKVAFSLEYSSYTMVAVAALVAFGLLYAFYYSTKKTELSIAFNNEYKVYEDHI